MNPYEMRYRLLELAYSNLKDDYQSEVETWQNLPLDDQMRKNHPSYPSVELVIELAKKMNIFLSGD